MELTKDQFDRFEMRLDNIQALGESLADLFESKDDNSKFIFFKLGKLHSYINEISNEIYIILDEIKHQNK